MGREKIKSRKYTMRHGDLPHPYMIAATSLERWFIALNGYTSINVALSVDAMHQWQADDQFPALNRKPLLHQLNRYF